MNKKIKLIIVSLLLVSGFTIYSCKKEDKINNSQKNQVANNLKIEGVDRLFDDEYTNMLIKVSGIDPKKLIEDKAIWDPFHNGLRAINACFIDKYLYFLENEPWNSAYCLEHLTTSRDYFAIGDTLNGLIAVNEAYAMTKCGSLTPFFYGGQRFDIPALEIAEQSYTFTLAKENLIEKYPTLNEIDEQFKMDILTLALFYSEYGEYKSAACRTKYNMRISAAILAGVWCSADCAGLLLPPLIVAAEIACATCCAYACYEAYDAYRNCH